MWTRLADAAVAHPDGSDTVAGAALDAPEFLDIDMDQPVRTLTFAVLSRLEPEAARAPYPVCVSTPDTVEVAMPSSSAISGPVNRSRLSRGRVRSSKPLARSER